METGADCISVLVAEDNHDLVAAISAVIADEPDMRLDGSVDRVCHLLDAVARTTSDVLVLDLELRGESSMPALVQLRRNHPRLAVVVYSGHDRRDLGPALAQVARCEYVTKSGNPEELIDAIRRAAKRSGAGD